MTASAVPVAPPAVAPARSRRIERAALGLPVAMLALMAAGATTSSSFLTAANLEAVLLSASIIGIAAVAMTPMTLSGNFVSLAVSQSAMLAALVFTYLVGHGTGVIAAGAGALALLAALGVIQGLVVAAGLNPVLTTLTVGVIVYGSAASLTSGEPVTVGRHAIGFADSQPLGIPLPIYVFAAVTVVATAFIRRTVVGREITLNGANARTAGISGINGARVAIWVFVLFSLGAGLAGILTGAQLEAVNVGTLETLTIDAGAAVLVGGTAIQGGEGSPLRSAAGAVIIALTTNILLLNDLPDGVRQTAVGAIVVFVVVALELLRRRGRS